VERRTIVTVGSTDVALGARRRVCPRSTPRGREISVSTDVNAPGALPALRF